MSCTDKWGLILYSVQWLAVGSTQLFELGRRHAGDLPELCRQMLCAAIAQIRCNLSQRLLIVGKELFHLFYFLQDKVLLNCDALYFREKLADIRIVFVDMPGKVFAYAKMVLDLTGLHLADDECFYLLYE